MSTPTISGDMLWTHEGNKFVIGTLHGELIQIDHGAVQPEGGRSSVHCYMERASEHQQQAVEVGRQLSLARVRQYRAAHAHGRVDIRWV